MIQFPQQQTLLCFRLLPLADIDQHIDGADDLAAGVAYRGGKWKEWNARAVRALGHSFLPPNRRGPPLGDMPLGTWSCGNGVPSGQ